MNVGSIDHHVSTSYLDESHDAPKVNVGVPLQSIVGRSGGTSEEREEIVIDDSCTSTDCPLIDCAAMFCTRDAPAQAAIARSSTPLGVPLFIALLNKTLRTNRSANDRAETCAYDTHTYKPHKSGSGARIGISGQLRSYPSEEDGHVSRASCSHAEHTAYASCGTC